MQALAVNPFVRITVLLIFLLAPCVAFAAPAGKSLTILIDGFASASPLVGYGLRNLKKKIPGAQLYSYVGAVEGWTYIAPKVIRDVTRAYRSNPEIEINLIGASFGANLLTRIVAKLDKNAVPVSYLGIIDGLPLTPITPNVRRVDNFTCSLVGCLRDRVELTDGNDITIRSAFDYRTTHIAVSNHEEVQRRILYQIGTYPLNVVTKPECARSEEIERFC